MLQIHILVIVGSNPTLTTKGLIMIKILDRGTPPTEQTYRCACSICKSKLEYSLSDLVKTTSDRNEEYHVLVCPVCSANVYNLV